MSSFVCLSPREEGWRCQKCAACIALRAWLKSLRVHLEAVEKHERVWFVTLTFREEPSNEAVGYQLVQRWLKAVRSAYVRSQGGEARLRYTCVSERGNANGRLHYHLVVYCGAELKKWMLDRWEHGFSRYKLASAREVARYILKYLSKGHGKVRSSTKLGVSLMNTVHGNDMVDAFLRALPGAKVVKVAGAKVPRELQKTVEAEVERIGWSETTRASSTRIELTGIDDETWDELIRHQARFGSFQRTYKEIEENFRLFSDPEETTTPDD